MARESKLNPQLTVWHRTHGSDASVQSATGFTIETCQRSLSVGGTPVGPENFRHYAGEAAYRLMLEISTGLRSELVGETNVFGQIKRAWQEQRCGLAAEHRHWVQQWFSDTKAIRTQHLQGVGGDSYASLCRRLLNLEPAARVFIVGGGELAASMLTHFRRHQCTLFLRAAPRFKLPQQVALAPLGALQDRIADCDAIIFCIPPSPDWERSLLETLSAHSRALIHLGYRQCQPTPLGELPHWQTLDALFALKRQQANVRSLKLAAAKRACGQRAEQVFLALARINTPIARAQ